MSTQPEPENGYPQLMSLAVHEFRTPLSVVGGYLRMLQGDTDTTLSERQRKMIDEAAKSCRRLVTFVAEMSDISKLDAGRIALSRQQLDLFTLVGEVAGGVEEARDRDVHLQVRGKASGAPLSGDNTRLRQAFDAIFRAILREKPGPSTVIAERRIDERDGRTMAIVVVAEDGSVQAAYERSPAPFNEERPGLGLALPLARRIIEGHGGRIWSPAQVGASSTKNAAGDALAFGSAIIALPVTE
jgi:signal transduction histidine kinase